MKKNILIFCILVITCTLLICNSNVLTAQTDTKKNNPKEEFLAQPKGLNSTSNNPLNEQTSSSVTFFKSFVIIILFLLALYLVLKWIQKKKLNLNQNYQENDVIKVLKTSSLAQNKAIHLVEIGKSIYILGSGDQISLVNKIENPAEIQEIKDQCKADQIQLEEKKESNFKDLFLNKLGIKSKEKNNTLTQTMGESLKFFNEQRDKLKELRNKF